MYENHLELKAVFHLRNFLLFKHQSLPKNKEIIVHTENSALWETASLKGLIFDVVTA